MCVCTESQQHTSGKFCYAKATWHVASRMRLKKKYHNLKEELKKNTQTYKGTKVYDLLFCVEARNYNLEQKHVQKD